MKKRIGTFAVFLLGMFSVEAAIANDAAVGAIVGGSVGAIVGSQVSGRDGMIVGGAVGAVAGAIIGSDNDGYRHRSSYRGYAPPPMAYAPVPAYRPVPVYRPAPVYYAPPPVYYSPPPVRVVSQRVVYVPTRGNSYHDRGYYDRGRHRR